jgi:multiple sugar transport system permease protein
MTIRELFSRYEKREVIAAYLFLLPAIAVVIAFVLVPVAGTFSNSFFRDVTYLPKKYVGLANFGRILTDADFHNAFQFTVLFTLVAVALETVCGLIFALLLNEHFKGRGVIRAVILIPWAVPTIVSAKVWKLIFDYSYGVLNWCIVLLGLSGDKINWLGTSFAAFWALIIAEVWKTTPFVVIILLAGLQAVPQEIYKQAKIDGAGLWKRLHAITLPVIRPVIIIALIFRTIDSLRIFDLVYVLTGGGPGSSTKTLSMIGFEMYTNDLFGKGSAVSVITFCLVFAITIAYITIGKFHESLQ